MRVRPYFKWFDFWIGWYWDRENRALYIGYFPMLGIKLQFEKPKTLFLGGVAIEGIIEKSHMEGDVKVIDKAKLTGVNLVPEHDLVDPHCKILHIDGGRHGEKA